MLALGEGDRDLPYPEAGQHGTPRHVDLEAVALGRDLVEVELLQNLPAEHPEAGGDVERDVDLAGPELGDRRLRLGGLERELDRPVRA